MAMNGNDHNKLVGIFLLAHGALQMLVFGILAIVYGVMGVAMGVAAKGEAKFVGIMFIFITILMIVIGLIFVLPQMLGGWKMFKEKPNARTWGIVGSIISLLSFPLGTAVGVYGLWFLFGDEGKRFYLDGGNSTSTMPPPPPNSWQQ